jgi:DNA polymerase elongation subunit (family B)
MVHDFIINVVDTDSISFCKKDMSEITKEEREKLLKEINDFLPDLIKMEDDGYYQTVIVNKAKNYILEKDGKIKIKGSGFTDSKRETALREMIERIIKVMLDDNSLFKIQEIYKSYIVESQTVTDISRWSTKRTITKSVMNPERTNEQKVLDALEGEDFREGDKIYVYFDVNDSLKLADKWQNDENKERLLKRVWNTLEIFENLLDLSQFEKYYLKSKRNVLKELIDGNE